MATQYIARNVDNTAKTPQPGDVEITDAFGNPFDNFNEYGVVTGADKDTPKNRLVAFYDKDNVLLDPQPAYQNLGYTSRTVDNQPSSPAFQPDAAQWECRDVNNQLRTPEPYVRSPLFPNVVSRSASPILVTLRVAQNESLIVTEDDVSGIELDVIHTQYPSIANYDSNS